MKQLFCRFLSVSYLLLGGNMAMLWAQNCPYPSIVSYDVNPTSFTVNVVTNDPLGYVTQNEFWLDNVYQAAMNAPFAQDTLSYTKTGLTQGQTYYVVITNSCPSPQGTIKRSLWSNVQTSCTLFPAPYTQSFNPPYGLLPNCWEQEVSASNVWAPWDTAPWSWEIADHTGNNGGYASNNSINGYVGETTSLISPDIDISNLSIPVLDFWVYSHDPSTSVYNKLDVEIFDGTTWHLAWTNQGDLGAGWYQKIIPLGQYSSNIVKARFSITYVFGSGFNQNIFLDDISFKNALPCNAPAGYSLGGVTTNTATISWNGYSDHQQYLVTTVPQGMQPTSGTPVVATGSPHTITGLQQGISYAVYVQAICTSGDTSNFSQVPNFSIYVPCVSVAGDSIQTAILVTDTIFNDNQNSALCYADNIGTAAPDVFYQVILHGCADSLFVKLCGTFDTYLHIMDSDSNIIASDDNSTDAEVCKFNYSSYLMLDVNAGDTLYVVVEGAGASDKGQYSVSIRQSVPNLPNPAFTFPDTNFCVSNTDTIAATISGMQGGWFSISPITAMHFDSTNGAFAPEQIGDYEITYTTGSGICFNSATLPIHIGQLQAAQFLYILDSFCQNLPNPLPVVLGQNDGVFYGSSGLILNSSTGEIILNASDTGWHSITYTVSEPCPDTQHYNVLIKQADDASFTFIGNSFYCKFNNGNNAIPMITGDLGGSFSSSTGVVFGNINTGAIDLCDTYIANDTGWTWYQQLHNVIYTTTGECPESDTAYILINFVVPESTQEIKEETTAISEYQVYPNPNNIGVFHLRSKQPPITPVNIELINTLGIVVLTQKEVQLIAHEAYTIPIPYHLTNGNYWLRVIDDKRVLAYPLILAR